MDIVYINIDTSLCNQVLGILQKLKEHEAIDKLGISRARAAFICLLFP